VKITYYSKYSARGPSSRFRIFQFLDRFPAAGIDLQVSVLFDDSYFEILRQNQPFRTLQKAAYTFARFRRRIVDLKADHSNLTVIEQQLFPYMPFGLEEKYLPKRYLVEFDDAIYLTHPKKLPELIRDSVGVIAGNRTLAEYAQEFNPNVHVVPTVLNTDVFKPCPKTIHEKVVVGWSGIEYNFKYLKTLAPVLERLIRKYPVELHVLSGTAPQDLGIPFHHVKWSGNREVAQMNDFDIGLMPLAMDEWCRGKCGLKLLQYMALEIPAVATPIGVNRQIVHHGRNGFLAEQLEEWETHLSHLIENANARVQIGKAARSTVLEYYSADVWFPTVAALYRKYGQE